MHNELQYLALDDLSQLCHFGFIYDIGGAVLIFTNIGGAALDNLHFFTPRYSSVKQQLFIPNCYKSRLRGKLKLCNIVLKSQTILWFGGIPLEKTRCLIK